MCADWNSGPDGVCFEACALLDPQCSFSGDGCYPMPSDASIVATCLPNLMSGFEGDECGTPQDCSAGLTCVGAGLLATCGGSQCCAAICDTANPVCVGANPSCTQLGVENQATVGVCAA